MPRIFVRRVDEPRKPELPIVVQRSLHAETAFADIEGYLDGVRDAVVALKRRGYLEAAGVLEQLRDAAIARLAEGGAI